MTFAIITMNQASASKILLRSLSLMHEVKRDSILHGEAF
jgi:hypothetical protein